MTPQRAVPETRASQLSVSPDRYFFLIGGLLLAIMAAAQIGSALQENPTNDEPVHLTAGYIYLTTGEYSMDLSHPPLGRILTTLPLLGLPLKHIPADRAWPELKTLIWGNQIPADTIILRARLVTIAITLILGAWLGWWTRCHFGPSVALLAMFFFTFDPTLIAHGHYVTTDLIATLGIFLTCTLWADFLGEPSWKRLVAAALALGFTVASKYSALFLVSVLPVLYVVAWMRKRGQPFFNWRGAIATVIVMCTGASVIIVLSYAPQVRKLILSPHSAAVRSSDPNLPPISGGLSVGFVKIEPDNPLLSFGYFQGLYELALHDANGLPSYLVGHFKRTGWWAYFPIAFLVKTPTAILAACIVALLSLWQGRRRPPPMLLSLCLTLPPIVYFILSLRASFNIGVRHILPVYPFLYVMLALVLMDYGPLFLRSAWRWTVAGLIVLLCAESLSVYPHYLAFFNWPSGGPVNGSHYLLDSNIDWGQDLKNLAIYVEDHHMTPLCTALFSGAPASYYGIVARDLNQTGTPEGVENLPCVVAVSVNLLRGLYNSPKKFAALRQRQPVARIGYSVFVYDLRH